MDIILQGNVSSYHITDILANSYPEHRIIPIGYPLKDAYSINLLMQQESVFYVEDIYDELTKHKRNRIEEYRKKKPSIVVSHSAPKFLEEELIGTINEVERHRYINLLLNVHKPETFIFSTFKKTSTVNRYGIDFINLGINDIKVIDVEKNKLI